MPEHYVDNFLQAVQMACGEGLDTSKIKKKQASQQVIHLSTAPTTTNFIFI